VVGVLFLKEVDARSDLVKSLGLIYSVQNSEKIPNL
jgi:hypothetical protein